MSIFTPNQVLSAVCEAAGVSAPEILGKERDERIVAARGVYALLCRELTQSSWPEIARVYGRTNHSAAVSSARRAAPHLVDPDSPYTDISMKARAILSQWMIEQEYAARKRAGLEPA